MNMKRPKKVWKGLEVLGSEDEGFGEEGGGVGMGWKG